MLVSNLNRSEETYPKAITEQGHPYKAIDIVMGTAMIDPFDKVINSMQAIHT